MMKNTCHIKMLFILICILCCNIGYAQRIREVSATITYNAPEDMSVTDAKLKAMAKAKIQAIADKFGTFVTQANFTQTESHNGESNTDFVFLGESVVQGEWIEDTSEPEFTIRHEDNMTIVTCTVHGRARERKFADVNFTSKVLCNGITPQYEKYDFQSGDNIYLSFQSAKDGYVAVFLLNAVEKNATCLLPFAFDEDGQCFVKHDKEYVFFNNDRKVVDGWLVTVDASQQPYQLYCEGKMEINQLIVIFSPNPFTLPIGMAGEGHDAKTLSMIRFEKWLAEARGRDGQMSVEAKTIHISNVGE